MKKSARLLGAVLFGSVSFVALAAHADEPAGWYVGGNGGLTHEEKLKTNLTPSTTGSHFSGVGTENSEIKSKDGYVGAAEVGYNWGYNIRTEIEGTFAENSARRMFGIGASGRTDVAAGFVNAFYDFDLTQFNIALPIVPYVGVGAGAAYWGQTSTFPQGTTVPHVGGNGFAFVYQGIAGMAYNVDDNWAVTADVRYMSTPAAEFGDNKPGHVTNDLTEEQVLLGVRYTFTQPTPAPVAAVAPTPAPMAAPKAAPAPTSYLVFFDFNKYNLTMDAKKIVDNAAMAAKDPKAGVTHLDVTGHTDTVGSDAYNMKLSKRRAEAVKAELVRQGVPANEIAIFAKGKKDPLVPTGDNVREPQNRRVEIVFH
jgi:outer membrane protein OmpA-like peptidoglycan-associated protein